VIAVDSSVAVAAFASWHALHDRARKTLAQRPLIPAHAALETYSVLTRLPAPHRVDAALALEFVAAEFPAPFLTLDGDESRGLLGELVEKRLEGGATYDALIAVTARRAGARLATCDRRAAATYERLRVPVDYIG
jgi:predicted nucleic acid-binding protein